MINSLFLVILAQTLHASTYSRCAISLSKSGFYTQTGLSLMVMMEQIMVVLFPLSTTDRPLLMRRSLRVKVRAFGEGNDLCVTSVTF